jgi:hypothetical protein
MIQQPVGNQLGGQQLFNEQHTNQDYGMFGNRLPPDVGARKKTFDVLHVPDEQQLAVSTNTNTTRPSRPLGDITNLPNTGLPAVRFGGGLGYGSGNSPNRPKPGRQFLDPGSPDIAIVSSRPLEEPQCLSENGGSLPQALNPSSKRAAEGQIRSDDTQRRKLNTHELEEGVHVYAEKLSEHTADSTRNLLEQDAQLDPASESAQGQSNATVQDGFQATQAPSQLPEEELLYHRERRAGKQTAIEAEEPVPEQSTAEVDDDRPLSGFLSQADKDQMDLFVRSRGEKREAIDDLPRSDVERARIEPEFAAGDFFSTMLSNITVPASDIDFSSGEISKILNSTQDVQQNAPAAAADAPPMVDVLDLDIELGVSTTPKWILKGKEYRVDHQALFHPEVWGIVCRKN